MSLPPKQAPRAGMFLPDHVIDSLLGQGWGYPEWEGELRRQAYTWNDGVKRKIIDRELEYFKEEILRLESEENTAGKVRAKTNSLESILKRLKGEEWFPGMPTEKLQRLQMKPPRLFGKDAKIRTLQNRVRDWKRQHLSTTSSTPSGASEGSHGSHPLISPPSYSSASEGSQKMPINVSTTDQGLTSSSAVIALSEFSGTPFRGIVDVDPSHTQTSPQNTTSSPECFDHNPVAGPSQPAFMNHSPWEDMDCSPSGGLPIPSAYDTMTTGPNEELTPAIDNYDETESSYAAYYMEDHDDRGEAGTLLDEYFAHCTPGEMPSSPGHFPGIFQSPDPLQNTIEFCGSAKQAISPIVPDTAVGCSQNRFGEELLGSDDVDMRGRALDNSPVKNITEMVYSSSISGASDMEMPDIGDSHAWHEEQYIDDVQPKSKIPRDPAAQRSRSQHSTVQRRACLTMKKELEAKQNELKKTKDELFIALKEKEDAAAKIRELQEKVLSLQNSVKRKSAEIIQGTMMDDFFHQQASDNIMRQPRQKKAFDLEEANNPAERRRSRRFSASKSPKPLKLTAGGSITSSSRSTTPESVLSNCLPIRQPTAEGIDRSQSKSSRTELGAHNASDMPHPSGSEPICSRATSSSDTSSPGSLKNLMRKFNNRYLRKTNHEDPIPPVPSEIQSKGVHNESQERFLRDSGYDSIHSSDSIEK